MMIHPPGPPGPRRKAAGSCGGLGSTPRNAWVLDFLAAGDLRERGLQQVLRRAVSRILIVERLPRRLRLSVGACDYCSGTLGNVVSVGATFLTMAKKACGLA
jgi:hypothetical protein